MSLLFLLFPSLSKSEVVPQETLDLHPPTPTSRYLLLLPSRLSPFGLLPRELARKAPGRLTQGGRGSAVARRAWAKSARFASKLSSVRLRIHTPVLREDPCLEEIVDDRSVVAHVLACRLLPRASNRCGIGSGFAGDSRCGSCAFGLGWLCAREASGMAMDAPHYAPVSEPRSEQPLKLFVGQVG